MSQIFNLVKCKLIKQFIQMQSITCQSYIATQNFWNNNCWRFFYSILSKIFIVKKKKNFLHFCLILQKQQKYSMRLKYKFQLSQFFFPQLQAILENLLQLQSRKNYCGVWQRLITIINIQKTQQMNQKSKDDSQLLKYISNQEFPSFLYYNLQQNFSSKYFFEICLLKQFIRLNYLLFQYLIIIYQIISINLQVQIRYVQEKVLKHSLTLFISKSKTKFVHAFLKLKQICN
ncbi:transmembrane protein, putative (macronuclear) [Tetrahymena thermophila SB210]|uniref:Transmembrane protein, putative n=1 Tax=Tetrahymena thermophila (strain SB210) TaxID=312017 RepID=W7XH09_TETTS|nr:transmembrane protein, putative [Tetrahymena thermophila SB210]EWS73586.1 transmembrane protein, putative [Tetrahymena thermophila SB210]|eukprot:XP_012653882.1 transmembrane protein, putative [Tetrahymena thermophila SB210]